MAFPWGHIVVDLGVQEITHHISWLRLEVKVTKVTGSEVASWSWCVCLGFLDLLGDIIAVLN